MIADNVLRRAGAILKEAEGNMAAAISAAGDDAEIIEAIRVLSRGSKRAVSFEFLIDKYTPMLTEGVKDRIERDLAPLHARIAALESKLSNFGYKGVWRDGNAADVGNFYTFGGSVWHCNEPTTERPGTSAAWTLAVKRGRSAKDSGQ